MKMPKKTDTEKPVRIPEQSQCLGIAEVSEIVNINYEATKKLMEDGAIRSFKLKTQLKTTREEVIHFLRECIAGTITHEFIAPVRPTIAHIHSRHRKTA